MMKCCCDKQVQMPGGSEFQTEGAAMLKLREAKIYRLMLDVGAGLDSVIN